MKWIALVVIVLFPVMVFAAQTSDANGALVGCVTDPGGQPLPGVTVEVSRGGAHQTVFSDAAGCYTLTDLPRGFYWVFARLKGFVSVTRDQLSIMPGNGEQLNFQMRVAPICECIGPPSTLTSLWTEADSVVRLRITGHEPASSPIHGWPFIQHVAAVLTVWKQHAAAGSTGDTLKFVQAQMYEETEPYVIGQEFVMFLDRQSTEGAFIGVQAKLGGTAAFRFRMGSSTALG
jgi:Carboxypeptidase regulatory-like domain